MMYPYRSNNFFVCVTDDVKKTSGAVMQGTSNLTMIKYLSAHSNYYHIIVMEPFMHIRLQLGKRTYGSRPNSSVIIQPCVDYNFGKSSQSRKKVQELCNAYAAMCV